MNENTNIEATFCFVDIAGYTALTDSHGELAAADLVDDFRDLIKTCVEPSGHLQSLTGDCAVLVFADPLVAIDALSTLYKSIADRREFPVVRTGLHHGPALFRGGHHFGSTVNLAARVAARATGGQILCTKHVADSHPVGSPGYRDRAPGIGHSQEPASAGRLVRDRPAWLSARIRDRSRLQDAGGYPACRGGSPLQQQDVLVLLAVVR